MESQPQNPEFRNNPENFHPCKLFRLTFSISICVEKTKKALARLPGSTVMPKPLCDYNVVITRISQTSPYIVEGTTKK